MYQRSCIVAPSRTKKKLIIKSATTEINIIDIIVNVKLFQNVYLFDPIIFSISIFPSRCYKRLSMNFAPFHRYFDQIHKKHIVALAQRFSLFL